MISLQRSFEAIGHTIVAVPAPRPRFRFLTQQVFRVIDRWMERGRQRRALADLDDRLLKDIGIARSDAAREIDKPFWR